MVLKTVTMEGAGYSPQPTSPRVSRLVMLYRRWTVVADLGAISVSSLVAFLLVHHSLAGMFSLVDRHLFTVCVVAATWFAVLVLRNSSPDNVLRTHAHDLLMVLRVTAQLVAVVVAVYFALHVRGIMRMDAIDATNLAAAIPLGLAGIIGARYLVLRRISDLGAAKTPVLLAGEQESVRAMARGIRRHRSDNFEIVGVCTTDRTDREIGIGDETVPVIGDDRDIVEAAQQTGAQLVAAATTRRLGQDEMQGLAADLEGVGVDLAVAAHPHRPDDTTTRMPVLNILAPGYRRARSISKRLFDIVFATLALLVSAPVITVLAVAIKVTSPGPVFYISERIGRNGVPFQMVKFRSMRAGSDRDTADLIAAADGNPVFFKVKADPRVTAVGAVIRKYSLDELPQFFNVLTGSMSVVGPRPQVQREVDAYDATMRRRLLVKPGITGQWQVSGRSNLSPAESIRHDVSYINNWSMRLDLNIIARTFGAVVRSEGAY